MPLVLTDVTIKKGRKTSWCACMHDDFRCLIKFIPNFLVVVSFITILTCFKFSWSYWIIIIWIHAYSCLCTNNQNCYYAMNHQELVQSVYAKMEKSICSLFVKLPIWHSLRGTLKVAIWIVKEMWSNCVQNFFGTNSNLLARFLFYFWAKRH
jgi:hypothetical protein